MKLIDVMQLENVNARARIWQSLDEKYFSKKQLRLLACDFAERALAFVDKPDKRSLEVIAVARRHATSDATDDELQAAGIAAKLANRASADSNDSDYPIIVAASNVAHPIASVAARRVATDAGFDDAERQWQVERVIQVSSAV